MVPVLHAFCALFMQIYYWALPSTIVDASADIEKGINVMENQQCGTTHSHCFMADSALALNPIHADCSSKIDTLQSDNETLSG